MESVERSSAISCFREVFFDWISANLDSWREERAVDSLAVSSTFVSCSWSR